MSDLDRLGRAVLLFHRGGQWTGQDRNEWVMLTGEEDATTKVLCDLARKLLLQHTQTQQPMPHEPETTAEPDCLFECYRCGYQLVAPWADRSCPNDSSLLVFRRYAEAGDQSDD